MSRHSLFANRRTQVVGLALALVAALVATLGVSHRGATAATPAGEPLYEFADTGTGPLPWNATALGTLLNGTTMLGAPHSVSNSTEGVIAYRTQTGDIALFTDTAAGTTSWVDLTSADSLSPAASDPVPFFDPYGGVDVIYVDAAAQVQLVTLNDAATPYLQHLNYATAWHATTSTDVTDLTGANAMSAPVSINVWGNDATLAYRSVAGALEVANLEWAGTDPIPTLSATPYAVTKQIITGTTSVTMASDPVVLNTSVPAVAVLASNGDLLEYQYDPIAGWSAQDVTLATGAKALVGSLSSVVATNGVDVAGLTSAGAVELFTTPALVSATSATWSVLNVTGATPQAPPMSGQITLNATSFALTVAGQAANWGDLFVLTSTDGAATWAATDVSVTAGSAARTVANAVSGITLNNQLLLFAAGINSPPPQGVGLYAIPSAKWSQSVTDGWPLLSGTGGLGTQAAPWVGFTSATSVATSPDFLMGKAIYNAHKRVTWLSYWTVSGPLANETKNTTTYYNHGFAAGQWVANQIDQYRGLGVGLKPDWVVFDPEGWPDNHSALDAPSGSSPATLAKYATYWAAMVKGWATGLTSVDPSLNPGVYASMSEYRNYTLSTLQWPVFMAVSFAGGGPIPIAGASGSNIRGYIAFNAVCKPAATLSSQIQTLLNPPWGGQFNSLQFNAGVYCAPPA